MNSSILSAKDSRKPVEPPIWYSGPATFIGMIPCRTASKYTKVLFVLYTNTTWCQRPSLAMDAGKTLLLPPMMGIIARLIHDPYLLVFCSTVKSHWPPPV
jgi:hypothetical protein